MEGTQPSTAGGDGAPTAMVAVPGLPGALTQAFPLLGGSGTVNGEHGGQLAIAREGLSGARPLARELARRDHEQQARRPVGEPTGPNSGGGAAPALSDMLGVRAQLPTGTRPLECV